MKESKKIDKYLDFARMLKKLWNMATVISVLVGTLGTVPEGLGKRLRKLEIRGRIETIQTMALLRSARILKKIPGDLRRLAITN